MVKLQETELTSKLEDLLANVSELTERNEAFQAVVGQSTEEDRVKLSDSDKQLSELTHVVADAVTVNRTKSMELKSLSSTVESLTCELEAIKVVFMLTWFFCSLVYVSIIADYCDVILLHYSLCALKCWFCG